MNNTRYEDFCNRMRVYRKRLGYNQADIGKELGISQNDYSKRENGLIMISYDNLKKLQEIGMDIDELVSGKRDDIDTKDLDELISDCESEELKDMTMRMVAECIKYYRVNDTKNKDNDTQNDRMFDFMLKQWDDFSMLEYVRHETHYSQEVMSEKLGLTRKKYRKYEKEIMYPDADTLVQPVRQEHWRDEDRLPVDIGSAQDLLLQRQRSDAIRPAAHRRQVVFVRQEHRRDEDRLPVDIRSAQDLLL